MVGLQRTQDKIDNQVFNMTETDAESKSTGEDKDKNDSHITIENNITGSLLMSMRGWVDESKENMSLSEQMERARKEKEKADAREKEKQAKLQNQLQKLKNFPNHVLPIMPVESMNATPGNPDNHDNHVKYVNPVDQVNTVDTAMPANPVSNDTLTNHTIPGNRANHADHVNPANHLNTDTVINRINSANPTTISANPVDPANHINPANPANHASPPEPGFPVLVSATCDTIPKVKTLTGGRPAMEVEAPGAGEDSGAKSDVTKSTFFAWFGGGSEDKPKLEEVNFKLHKLTEDDISSTDRLDAKGPQNMRFLVNSKKEAKLQGKVWTPPFDARFPNQNQTRNCWQNYVDYHRCIKIKGDDYPPCEYFQKVYTQLCPLFWIENWDDQREAGTFPGKI